jgi:hypothetical protein
MGQFWTPITAKGGSLLHAVLQKGPKNLAEQPIGTLKPYRELNIHAHTMKPRAERPTQDCFCSKTYRVE